MQRARCGLLFSAKFLRVSAAAVLNFFPCGRANFRVYLKKIVSTRRDEIVSKRHDEYRYCDARLPRSGGIPYIFKAYEKSPFAGFVPQSGISVSIFFSIKKETLWSVFIEINEESKFTTYNINKSLRRNTHKPPQDRL